MIYKKRSDEWPNVFSKWKNKSRCSNKPYRVDYNDLEDEEALKILIDTVHIHTSIMCFLEPDVHLLKE